MDLSWSHGRSAAYFLASRVAIRSFARVLIRSLGSSKVEVRVTFRA